MNTKLALSILGGSLLLIGLLFFQLQRQSDEIETLENDVVEVPADTQEQEKLIVVVDITSSASDAMVTELANRFRELPKVEKVSIFSSTDTLMNFRDANRSNTAAMEEIENFGGNPFPARIRLELSNESDVSVAQNELARLDADNIINATSVGNDAMYEF